MYKYFFSIFPYILYPLVFKLILHNMANTNVSQYDIGHTYHAYKFHMTNLQLHYHHNNYCPTNIANIIMTNIDVY